MKINITATSKRYKDTIIEANSIDDAIKRLQTDEQLVKSVIDSHSNLYHNINNPFVFPTKFVVNTHKYENYDVDIEIYDNYRE